MKFLRLSLCLLPLLAVGGFIGWLLLVAYWTALPPEESFS
jgi:hypothetical protein